MDRAAVGRSRRSGAGRCPPGAVRPDMLAIGRPRGLIVLRCAAGIAVAGRLVDRVAVGLGARRSDSGNGMMAAEAAIMTSFMSNLLSELRIRAETQRVNGAAPHLVPTAMIAELSRFLTCFLPRTFGAMRVAMRTFLGRRADGEPHSASGGSEPIPFLRSHRSAARMKRRDCVMISCVWTTDSWMSQRISSMRASVAHASARPSNRWGDIARSFLLQAGARSVSQPRAPGAKPQPVMDRM